MVALQCDRCNVCYPRPPCNPVVKVKMDTTGYDDDRKVDLCPKCQEEIEIFLRIPKEKRTNWADIDFK